MPAPDFTIEPSSIVEVTFWFTYQSSICMNVFHYVTNNTIVKTNGVAIVTEIGDYAKQQIWNSIIPGTYLKNITSPNCTLNFVRAQKVAGDRKWYIDEIVNEAGTYSIGQDLPSDVQWCLSLQATRVGRGRTGSKHFTGMMSGMYANAYLAATFISLAQLVAVKVQQDLNPPSLGASCTPIIWNSKHPTTFSYIHGAVVQNQVRVMRRRQVGLGI